MMIGADWMVAMSEGKAAEAEGRLREKKSGECDVSGRVLQRIKRECWKVFV